MVTSENAKNLATCNSERKRGPVHSFSNHKFRMKARRQELKKKSDSKLYMAKKKLLVKITSEKKEAYFLAPA